MNRKNRAAGAGAEVEEKLARFGVTVPEFLLAEFDERRKGGGKGNRSEVIRQLIRKYVTEGRWQEENGQVYGTATLMYNHHAPSISKALTDLQHDHGENIICVTHVHVAHDACLECIVLRGKSSRVRAFIRELSAVKGIKSLDTVITSGV
jgi:CopG family nickel-responsive transcriptional regulator